MLACHDTNTASRLRRSCCSLWIRWASQPAAPPHTAQLALQAAALRQAAHHLGALQQVVAESQSRLSSHRLSWRWGQPKARVVRAALRSCEDNRRQRV
jgi:hypothetical protein